MDCLNNQGIKFATKIQVKITCENNICKQCKVIPIIQEGGHLIFSSISGSGKTFAYLIPLVDKIFDYQKAKLQNNKKLNETVEKKIYHELIVEEMLEKYNYLIPKNPPFFIILTPTNILANQIKVIF